MNKKDISLIVKALNSIDFELHLDEQDYLTIVRRFAILLKEQNPSFNTDRFYLSVGLEAYTEQLLDKADCPWDKTP